MFQNLALEKLKGFRFGKRCNDFSGFENHSFAVTARKTDVRIVRLAGTVHDTAHHGDLAETDMTSRALQRLNVFIDLGSKPGQVNPRASARRA